MTRTQANILLLAAAACWGFGNVPQKTVLTHLDPFTAVGLRGLIGALLLWPLLWRRSTSAPIDMLGLARVSGYFSLALMLQQVAYLDASVTNASILVNLGVILTPFFAWLLYGERVSPKFVLAVTLAIIGLLLMTGSGGRPGQGDLLAVVSAAAYALWTIELALHLGRGGSAALATIVQFLTVGVIALAAGCSFAAPTLSQVDAALLDLVLLGAFSTALPYGCQAAALRLVTPAHASLIVSLEGLFGVMGAFVLLGERPTLLVLTGAALLLFAIAYAGAKTEGVRGV